MKIIKVKELKIKKPPTSVCSQFNNIYVSTKGKRVFYTSDTREFKSILFSSQVNSMTASNCILFCVCEDGKVFGLSENHKVIYRSSAGDSVATHCLYDSATADIMVSTFSKKIVILTEHSMLKDSYFCFETPVIYFDFSVDRNLACVSQNNKNIKIFSLKESNDLKVVDGFPEVLKFISNEIIVVGTSKGSIQIYSIKTRKRITGLDTGSEVHSIFIIDSNYFLVGLSSKICLYKYDNFSIELIDELPVNGIPVAFCLHNKGITAAISRESRLGRWNLMKKGRNSILSLEIK